MNKKYPIVMLGSGAGSTIDFFCEKASHQDSLLQIVAIVTESPTSPLNSIAKKYNIPFYLLPFKKESTKDWDQKLKQILMPYNPQLILLAGFLKKIGPQVLAQFHGKIINSHPALLPEFSGMYGSHIHRAVIEQGKQQTGVSIHVVNEEYDKGLILHQQILKVLKDESAGELEKRIKDMEKEVYLKAVLKMLVGK